MKTSMLIALMTEGFILVGVKFRQQDGSPSRKTYHYKHCGEDIEVGDMVVVESPSDGFVITDVVEVDRDPVLDVDAGFSYKWTVQKVDTKEYYAHRERELGLTKHLKRLKNKAIAEQTLATIRKELEGTDAGKEFEGLVSQLNQDFVKHQNSSDQEPMVYGEPGIGKSYYAGQVPAQSDEQAMIGKTHFMFWYNRSGPAKGHWNFCAFGDSAVHKGFASFEAAKRHAEFMVKSGVFK